MALKVGLQLYSIRDEMEKDMAAALRKVKEIGYDYVEFAGYYGKSAEEIRSLLDEIGLSCVSVHQTMDLFLEKGQEAVDFLKTLGVSFCGLPSVPSARLHDDFPQLVSEIKQVGELMKKNGIQLVYHNHDFEFDKRNGKYLLDELYETIPADLLQTELDVCWVHYGGEEPCAFVKKYAGRADIVHIKDFTCDKLGAGPVYDLIDKEGKAHGNVTQADAGFRFQPVGSGIQNVPALLEAFREAGSEYVIVEQDSTYELASIEAVKRSRDYLKSLGV